MGLSSFSSALIFLYLWFVGQLVYLPCHSIAFAMLPLDLCLLGLFWACHALFFYSIHVAQCFYWVNPYTILAFLSPFYYFGILDPLYPFGHPWPILFLHSHKLLLHHLGFPDLITTPFAFKACWPLYQPHLLIHFFRFLWPIFACFPFLIIPMGLLLPCLGSLGPVCFLWGLSTILQAHRPLFLPFGFYGFLLILLILLSYSPIL